MDRLLPGSLDSMLRLGNFVNRSVESGRHTLVRYKNIKMEVIHEEKDSQTHYPY